MQKKLGNEEKRGGEDAFLERSVALKDRVEKPGKRRRKAARKVRRYSSPKAVTVVT